MCLFFCCSGYASPDLEYCSWWLFQPRASSLSFKPGSGLYSANFLPWVTLMYVVVAPEGSLALIGSGWGWLWLPV